MEENVDLLYESIVTQQDRQEILTLLDNLSQSFFKTGANPAKNFSENKKFGPLLLAVFPHEFEKKEPGKAQKLINDLISKISAFPQVEIIVASLPSQNSLDALAKFAKKKLPEKFVISLEIKPEILGGAILIINGKYIDLSIASKLNSAFEKNNLASILELG